MALQLTYNLQGDTPIAGAYLRIEDLGLRYEPITADALSPGLKFVMRPSLQVKSGKTKNVLDRWQSSTWVVAYDHTSNVNAIKQAYAYLKTLPEFSVAIDSNE